MNKKLKIFADKNWLPDGKNHTIVLYPFWGEIPLPAGDPDDGRFEGYVKNGNEIFEMTSTISDCNIAVLPFEYSFEKQAQQFAENAAREAGKENKKLLVFYNSDDPSQIKLNNSIIFRTSFLSSQKKQNEFGFPGWSVDFLEKYSNGKLEPLRKSEKPAISYCGYVDSLEEKKVSLKQRIENSYTEQDFYGKGSVLRGKAVRYLLNDNRITTNFLIRNGFWAEGISDKIEARKQYAENMLSSPYSLVARGAGNFSYRLYEVMSCGKIPVFIDTDCVLPYENFINWKASCVWLNEKDVKNISSTLVHFHNYISEGDLIKMQITNRKIYEEWLCPEGFFKNIHKLLN